MNIRHASGLLLEWDTRLSIRTRLILLLTVLSGPFMLYLVLSTKQQTDEALADARQHMLGAAHLAASKLDAHVGSVEQLLSVLSFSVGFTLDDAGRNNLLLRELGALLPAQINTVSVWTSNGMNIGALDGSSRLEGINVAQRKFFRDALASPDLVMLGPLAAESNGEMVILLARSIRRAGRSQGVVIASIKLKMLQALLRPGEAMPPETVITVTNESGVVLARSLDSEIWIGRRPRGFGQGALADSLARRDGVRDEVGSDGIRRVAGFSATSRAPWWVDVGVPADVAMAPVHQRLSESIAVGAVMLLIGLALAALVAEGIASPLRRLSEHAAAFERGELAHRSDVRHGGEIGRLASALNRAAESVLQRTAAMQASQDQLQQIADNLPAMISYLDLGHRFTFVNQVHKEWLGVEAHSLIGNTPLNVFGERGCAQVQDHFHASLRGTRVIYERDLMTVSGVRRVEVTLVPHLDADRHVRGVICLTRDVTQSREAEALRILSEERLSLALDGSSLALFDWDVRRDRVYHSPQAASMRGYAAREVTTSARALRAQMHPEDRDLAVARMRAVIFRNVDQYDTEFRMSTVAGGWVWLRAKGSVVMRDGRGRAMRLAGTYVDVTQQKFNEKRLRHLAEVDSLTGLSNRSLFMERLDQTLERSRRTGKSKALLFLDVDRFKSVNDTLGHAAGDELLKAFGRILRSCVQGSDTVARLGGDEFTIILEDPSNVDDVRAVARKLVERARRPIVAADQSVVISTSIGIAMVSPDERDASSVMRRADAALYEAKRLGRNRYAFSAETARLASPPLTSITHRS